MKKSLLFSAIQLLAVTTVMAQPLGMPKLVPNNADGQDPTDIISQAPEGETKYYNESYEGWVFWGQEYGLQFMSGTTTNKIVWCSNGEVYIQNPVANYSTGTFAKGTYADGKITVELPQCIGSYYDTDGNMKDMYLNKLEEVEQDGEKYYMICYPEDNYLEYDVDDAGNVKLNLGNSADYDVTTGNNPKYLVGVTYSNEPHALQVWSGYGDTFETWNIIDNGEPVTPPADAVMQEWAFETLGKKSIVQVAVDGNDIYVDGFTSYMKGYWFKGTMEDGKITFPTNQYMGKNEWDQFYYFMAARIFVDETSEWNQYEPIDKVTLVYNPETGMYTAQEDETFIVSMSNEYISATAIAENPSMWQQTPEMFKAKPLNPSLTNCLNNPGISTLEWDIPNENEKGAILSGNKMYYNLYVDGELYTFTPEEYPLFTEPTTDVPYEASNYYDIYVYNTSHTIYVKKDIAETVALQSFYVDEDGTKYASDLVTENVLGTGIGKVEGGKQAVSTEYFNLSGVKTTRPAAGMYIMKTKYNDGTSSVKKVLVK
ncbi:putative uncharacterized protein [Prevotella sp. CAG:1058]|nr:putative uncharacterized protein [Prevotella sp. CAG:1058]